MEQFISKIPKGESMTLEGDVLSKWKRIWEESDATSTDRNPTSIRFPSAWEKDLYDCWNGNCFFEPSKIKNPTLLIRGEWDTILNGEDADQVFTEIKNAPLKKYVVIEKGTHVMHLGKSRYQLYDETQHFLKVQNNNDRTE